MRDGLEDEDFDIDVEDEPEQDAEVKPQRPKRKFWFKHILIAMVLGLAAGIPNGMFVLWQGEQFDDLEVLETYKPLLYTRVFDRKGNLIDIISTEQRFKIEYEDIPKDFVHALVAVEDEYFFSHIGFSPVGMLSALRDGLMRDYFRGASTLTQQLVKNITKDKRYAVSRKAKELFLAVQLERMFTKAEIFSQYVNEVPFGNNQFGIEAAARYYFDKPTTALNLVESATLAGIPQAPTRFNPYRYPDACINKRNIVLERMAVEGFITREQAQTAKKEPLILRDRREGSTKAPLAAHFMDKVRNHLFDKYGEEQVRTSGWDIHTTLDLDYQRIAESAVKEGLKGVDKTLGYRNYDAPSALKGTDLPEDEVLKEYFDPSWRTPIQDGVNLRAIVTHVSEEEVRVRIKEHTFLLTYENMKWISRKKPKDLGRYFKVGDVPLFKVILKENLGQDIDLDAYLDEENIIPFEDETVEADVAVVESEETEDGEVVEAPEPTQVFPFELELDQEPELEGSFMAVDTQSGDILAMVGGYDYRRSKFNRADQALRQVGSAFKPIIFGAALERGYTLSDTLFDEPTLFVDPTQFEFDDKGEIKVRTRNATIARKMRLGLIPTPKPYQPHNYYNRYVGKVTLRSALAQSKNIVSVKLLNSVGYDRVLDYVNRLRLYKPSLQPFPSLALGAMEMTLQDMVYSYSSFSNLGVRYEPRFVRLIMDSKGRIIEDNPAKGEQVVSPQNAYLVKEAMRAVIFDPKGSGKRALQLKYPHLAGKTGTTNDYADAWFIGFSPNIAAGVWVGHDIKRTIGRGRAGSNTALPIWQKFYEGVKDDLPKEGWALPEDMIKIPIDRVTGKKLTPDCDCDEKDLILETYIKGTEPTSICTAKEKKAMTGLPWYLQKRTYQYDTLTGEMKPNTVMIDNASQLKALEFIDSIKQEAINEP